MHYPLINRELLSSLRFVHAGYNLLVAFAFFYHGSLGIKIRRARLAKAPLPFPSIKKHRKTGPLLAGLGIFGFFIGFTLVLLHTGNLLEYPAHFFVGIVIILLLSATIVISRRIKGAASPFRNPHYFIGIAILFFYAVEVFLGLGVLF